ncbi:hypothetical protein, partial [Staphylococcus aureus]
SIQKLFQGKGKGAIINHHLGSLHPNEFQYFPGNTRHLLTETEKQWLCETRMVISVSVVYPHDGVADWEPGLSAAAQHRQRKLSPSRE